MAADATEITLVQGPPILVEGEVAEVEAVILAAARGSLMELAWLPELGHDRRVGLNPAHVVAVRPAPSG